MPYKILLVEDDQPILELMDILLKRLGYEPVLMQDADEALARVRQEPPDLILLDIMMTPINGWQFLEKLRCELKMTGIPVILFTAYPAVEEKIAVLKDRHLGILIKPVSLDELKRTLEQFLQG
jgi:DNA-binding response OmpR family regulator